MTHYPFVTTLLFSEQGEKCSPAGIDAIRRQISGESDWQWLQEGVACDLFHAEAQPSLELDMPADIFTQPNSPSRRKQLLISDMDSTLIEQECIDELAAELGLKEEIANITERAMNGELDFEAALKARVAMLAGLPEHALADVFASRITFMPGAKVLAATMKRQGASLIVVSGGFDFFTNRVREALGFDRDYSNQLIMEQGALTGEVLPPVLGGEAKLATLKQEAQTQGLDLSACLAVGDGANDLPMLQAAGLGVAYRAKPAVQKALKGHGACINHHDLSALLFLQGYHADEWKRLN